MPQSETMEPMLRTLPAARASGSLGLLANGSRTLLPRFLAVALLSMLLIPSVATSAAPGTGKERQVVKERLEAPSNPDVPARLRYGILMVPGSERVTSKNGKTVFERVDGVPERDQYSISPAGVLAFHRKNRGDALLASYTYRPRRVAVLPIQMDAGPKELKQRTRRDTCELFQAFGYEVVPESRVENLVQQRRLYASSTLDAATLTDLGKELGADDVVVVQTVEWTQAAGKSLASMVISRNPFGGPSKNVKVVLHSRLFDASDGRLVWESHQTSNRRGSTLFGVSDDLKRLAVNKAIIDLFASYFEP